MSAFSMNSIFVFLIFLLFIASPAQAAPQDRMAGDVSYIDSETETSGQKDPRDTDRFEDVDYKKMESLGLVTNQREGALGRNLWEGTSRKAISALLPALPVQAREAAIRKLILGILLSRTDADDIDDSPAPGQDLLTLRLEKLLELGAYQHAFNLYTQIGSKPYHPRLAKMGILSMFFTGEKSLGCLEANTALADFPEDAFLQTGSAYCDLSLSDPEEAESDINFPDREKHQEIYAVLNNEDYIFSYSPERFSKLTDLEKAVLAAENRISLPKKADLSTLPPSDAQLFLSHDDLSYEEQLAIAIRAADYGLTDTDTIKELYISAAEPASGNNFDQISTPAELPDWQKLPYYFYTAANAPKNSNEAWNKLRNVLALKDQYPVSAFLPFTDMIRDTKPDEATAEEIQTAYEIMSRSQESIPGHWIDLTIEMAFASDSQKNDYLNLLGVSYLLKSTPQTYDLMQEIAAETAETGMNAHNYVNKIIENIDKSAAENDNADAIYEKDFNLTFRQDYVMPSILVWDRLLEASQNGIKGETILLSALALGDEQAEDLYPGLLLDVLAALSEVGLTHISEELAISALLGNIN